MTSWNGHLNKNKIPCKKLWYYENISFKKQVRFTKPLCSSEDSAACLPALHASLHFSKRYNVFYSLADTPCPKKNVFANLHYAERCRKEEHT